MCEMYEMEMYEANFSRMSFVVARSLLKKICDLIKYMSVCIAHYFCLLQEKCA